jgi:hypothetical protein
MMRGLIILLAIVFALASAGSVLCEIDCASGGSLQGKISMEGNANGATSMRCHNHEGSKLSHDRPAPDRNSGGNTKKCGVHGHTRIVAKANAGTRAIPAGASRTPALVSGSRAGSAFNENNLRSSDFSPPISPPSVFTIGVLRI